MAKRILTVTVNPALDKTVTVPGFTVGSDFRETALSISAGGKGINVSRVLRFLGVRTTASGFLGGHDGRYILRLLKKEGIPHDFFPIADNTRTSLTILDPRTNTITRVIERGPHITKRELRSFREKFRSLLGRFDFVVLSGRNVPGAPASLYADLVRDAHKRKVKAVCDTSGSPLCRSVKAGPYMVKPNLHELGQLTGAKLATIKDIKAAVHALYKSGISVVAVTLGSKGAIAFNGMHLVTARPPRIRRASPVGCGDTFIAGFLSATINGQSFAHAVRFAVASATANALSINPGAILKGTIRKILREVHLSVE